MGRGPRYGLAVRFLEGLVDFPCHETFAGLGGPSSEMLLHRTTLAPVGQLRYYLSILPALPLGKYT